MAVDTTSRLQRPFGREYTTVATSITLWPLSPMTPAGALLLGLLDRAGRLNHVTYDRMVRAIPGTVAGVLRPHHEAARPGRL
jgi:hypothetical protein